GAKPDHQPSRGDLLEGRDGRSLCHRMAIARDQHGGAKFEALRLFGDAGESDPYVVAKGGNLGTPRRRESLDLPQEGRTRWFGGRAAAGSHRSARGVFLTAPSYRR